MSHSTTTPIRSRTKGRRHGISARADMEWERIMVQITFAFVIILGYLLSVGMSEAKQLAKESERHRKVAAELGAIVTAFSNTDAGKERAKWVVAEKELQLQRLLFAWTEVKSGRELRKRLNQFLDADFVILSDEFESLPVGEGFQVLKAEIDRVFLSGIENVSVKETNALLIDVVEHAGFDLRNAGAQVELPPGAAAQQYDARMVTRDNVEMLQTRIESDLNKERGEVVRIQCDLVDKIAGARKQKLLALPLDQKVDIELDLDVPDLGAAMRDLIVEELGESMTLLPESTDWIYGPDETVSESVEE